MATYRNKLTGEVITEEEYDNKFTTNPVVQTSNKENLPSKIFRGATEPLVTMLARPVQAVESAVSYIKNPTAQPNLDINLPYYGTIKAPQGAWDIKKPLDTKGGGLTDIAKDVGRGLETVALGMGGGGNVAKQGLLGAAKTGAIQGAKMGSIFGAGARLEETGTAKGALGGAVTGGIGGAVIGFATPFATEGGKRIFKGITGGLKSVGEKTTGCARK